MIDDSIQIQDGQSLCSFPFIKDPHILSNNRVPMLRRSEKLEENLRKKGLLESYNLEFNKFIERKVISEVTMDEIDNYDGPINSISHHGVLQPTKVTTPLRIVSNSSQDNRGHSLNSCLPKGRNTLCDLYKLIIKFRCYEDGLVFDISKPVA